MCIFLVNRMKRKRDDSRLVYSTDPSKQAQPEETPTPVTPPPHQQELRVWLDRKQRRGKSVTLIKGFVGRPEDLKQLGKELKSRCGVGGTVKNGEVLLQGDCRDQAMDFLTAHGYKAKRAGG